MSKDRIKERLERRFKWIPYEIDELKEEISQIEQTAMVKGVSFDKVGGGGGISNDEKLNNIAYKTDMLEREIRHLKKEAAEIDTKLHLYEFSDDDIDMLEQTAKGKSYKQYGDDKGYHKNSIYYRMRDCYEKLEKYMKNF